MDLSPEFKDSLARAIREHSPLPQFPPAASLEDAYARSPEVAQAVCDVGVRGIKAGLTHPDMQALFGIDAALLGFLYDHGELQSGAQLAMMDNSQIECELYAVLDPKGRPRSFGPAIEFVHLHFERAEDFTPANLVLCSLGADKFMLGQSKAWGDFDALRDVVIRLERDGELVLEASPYDSLGGPEEAVPWCLEEARARQFQLEEDALVLMGTCGSGVSFTPGNYVADYGPLGSIKFEITE